MTAPAHVGSFLLHALAEQMGMSVEEVVAEIDKHREEG